MLKRISDYLAHSLGERLQSSSQDIEVFAYGLQVLLGSTVKLLVILGIAYILDIFFIVVFFLMSFILLRRYGGGVHFSTYGRCLSSGLILTVFFGKIVKGIMVYRDMLWILSSMLLVIGVLTILLWVPGDTHKRRIVDKKDRIRQKIKTSLALLFTFGVVAVLYSNYYYQEALAVVLGGFVSFYLISPQGYETIYAIDHVLNKYAKGEGREENV